MTEAAGSTVAGTGYFCYECNDSVDVSLQDNILKCLDCAGDFIEEESEDLLNFRNIGAHSERSMDWTDEASQASLDLSVSSWPEQADSSPQPPGIMRNRRSRSLPPPNCPTSDDDIFEDDAVTHHLRHLDRSARIRAFHRIFGRDRSGDFIYGVDEIYDEDLFENDDDFEDDEYEHISPEDIEKLPITILGEEQAKNWNQCTTCIELLVPGKSVARLDCGHVFHRSCIVPWLQQRNTCPLCRRVLDPSSWKKEEKYVFHIDELD